MSTSASQDMFYKYRVQNKLDDKSTIQECFEFFDKNK